MATEASGRSKRRPSSHPQHRLDFPPPLRPPSSVPLSSLSFHAIGQKTSSSVASASLESEAARRRFGEGKADGGEGREGGGMGKFRGGGERQQKSKFLARQRGEQGDVVLVRWRRRRARRPKCETEALSDILDCNCRRERVKEHAPLSKIRRKRRKERKR